ncbi:MAG: CobD/CbiB family protein [Sulfuricellaceae bacterium]|nr:CobD/CbiB family protein [Sulfuricellaceae bacterium]
MSLFSLIAALLLEQFRPFEYRSRINRFFIRYANYLEHRLNAGEHHHGALAWCLAVLPPVIFLAALGLTVYRLSPLLAWVMNVAVLYVTVGFKKFSETANDIAGALKSGDSENARSLVGKWLGRATDECSDGEVARLSIEHVLMSAYRQLFGVIFWFLLLGAFGCGAAGALLYTLAFTLYQKWGGQSEHDFGSFGRFSIVVFDILDWLPLRMTAVSFAVMGDFEDAIYCWRGQAANWTQQGIGILLASGAGALGVKLGGALRCGGNVEFRCEIGLGDEADGDYIESALGLIWRTLMMWLVLLLLLTMASWAG